MLYQHGTLGTLIAGMLQGTTSIGEVMKQGNFGIGTLDGSDGEVVILDGNAYHANAQGEFKALTGEELTPFATVTDFQTDETINVRHITDAEALLAQTKRRAASDNIFFAVKMTGKFEMMHVRMMPKEEPPYRRLSEVAKNQPEFTRERIEGTIVGFYAPQLFHGIAAGGYHLHFVDGDRTFGGHVLDFEMNSGTIEINNIDTLQQHLPSNDAQFMGADIDYSDIAQEISETE